MRIKIVQCIAINETKKISPLRRAYFEMKVNLVDPVSNMEMQACRNVERINKMKISVNLKTISIFVFINKIDIFIQISNSIVREKSSSFHLYMN